MLRKPIFYKDPVQKETLMQRKKTKSKQLLHLSFTNQILGIKGKFYTGDIYASGDFPGLRYGYRKNVRQCQFVECRHLKYQTFCGYIFPWQY